MPAPMTLYRTASGQRLHIRPCPHIHGVDVTEVGADEVDREICTWCQAEIDGVGRTYYAMLDDALRAYGSYADTWAPIRRYLADVEYDSIWVPNSQSYVALGLDGRGVAWVGKTYVWTPSAGFQELPGYVGGSGGGLPADAKVGDICPIHFVAMSLTGTCDDCD